MKRIKPISLKKERESETEKRIFLYDKPPIGMMTIEELLEIGKERIILLKELDRLNMSDKEDEKTIRELCNKHMPLSSSLKIGVDLKEQIKRDHVSHLITMLSFSNTPFENWFKAAELLLFRFRYSNVFLQEERFQIIQKYLIKDMGLELKNGFISLNFELAPEIVARREVEFSNGIITISVDNSLPIISSKYSSIMDETLLKARRKKEILIEKKIIFLLNDLQKIYEQNFEKNLNINSISLENIGSFIDHFPPCMKRLHKALLRDNHLKYFGRQQYGLFLKSIGLSLEESLCFWKKHFSAKYTEDVFERNYSYNIRYIYGKEGKKVDHTAYSCIQTITTNRPSNIECHGCPFKELDKIKLEEMLKSEKLSEENIFEIIEKTKQGKFQSACSLLHARKRNTEIIAISFPRDFFIAETTHAKNDRRVDW